MQQFIEKSNLLKQKVFSEIKQNQLAILKPYYNSLNLDENKLNTCILKNDISVNLSSDVNTTIINKLKSDLILASSLNISGVPQMYVNGIEIYNTNDNNFTSDYNYVSKIINIVEKAPVVDWNYENRSYVMDTSKKPSLMLIVNDSSELFSNNALKLEQTFTNSENLTPEIKSFFSNLFSEVPIKTVSYTSDSVRDLIESNGIINLPVMVIDGNMSSLDILKDENQSKYFKFLFNVKNSGIYVLDPQVTKQLIVTDEIQPLYQLTSDEILKNNMDYKQGTGPINMYVFCDLMYSGCDDVYTNIYTKLINNYIDTNKVTLINKDFISNELVSLYPILFTRCAQEQGKYSDAVGLINNQFKLLSPVNTVKPVIDKYQTQISELNTEYNELTTK
jgi:hypothetical protein